MTCSAAHSSHLRSGRRFSFSLHSLECSMTSCHKNTRLERQFGIIQSSFSLDNCPPSGIPLDKAAKQSQREEEGRHSLQRVTALLSLIALPGVSHQRFSCIHCPLFTRHFLFNSTHHKLHLFLCLSCEYLILSSTHSN